MDTKACRQRTNRKATCIMWTYVDDFRVLSNAEKFSSLCSDVSLTAWEVMYWHCRIK